MTETLRSLSPSDPADQIGRFDVADAAAVDAAVARARRAFPAWRDAGLAARTRVLERFRDAAAGRVDELATLIAREVGKALWDARAEAALLGPKVIATLADGMALVAPREAAPGQRAVAETALSVAGSTGRCTCARRLFVHRAVIDAFQERLVAVLGGLRIGPPLEEGVFMGPLVSTEAAERIFVQRTRTAEAGGERVLLVEPDLPLPYVGAGLVRYAGLAQEHPIQRDELFGPEAALYAFDALDEAIAAANDFEYGLVASVFTRDRARYEHCIGRIRTGLLNWNKSTVGASGRLPFGGIGKSGNDRPAGITATLYCTVAQAHLESEAPFDPAMLPPGMPEP